ncbi:MAG: T9SS type A sorting domain-containing protein [Bacteroidota bacterium]
MSPKYTSFTLFLLFFCFCLVSTAEAQYAIPAKQPRNPDSIRVISVTSSKEDQQLMINFSQPIKSDASLSLFNLHGKEVQRTEVKSNKELVELDLSELPEGMYVAVISGDEVHLSQYVFKEF